MKKIVEEEKKQKNIVEQVNKMQYPFKNILFKVYVQGKSLVTVASEMKFNYEYTKKMNGIALNKFDELQK